ncbi:MAG: hypothetical protein ACREKL_00610 [Chthoniobacterales bacterium]
MRTTVLFAAVVLFVTMLSARAGRLDIAIVQFSDERDQASIEASLGKVDLMKVVNSDRMETGVSGLRGGDVLFVQSVPATSGMSFSNSTRLGIQRADVEGALSGSNVSVRVTIFQGVKVGLRKFRSTEYTGAGSVAGGGARLISYSQSTNKSQTMVKDRSTTITYKLTTIMIAQYQP